MARYPSLLDIKTVCRGRENFRKAQRDMGDELPELMLRAGTIIERRCKLVITEKGHVVTGNLRRSYQTVPRDYRPRHIEVAVVTPVAYGPKIEYLPDGGVMVPAFILEKQNVERYIHRGCKAIIERNVLRGRW